MRGAYKKGCVVKIRSLKKNFKLRYHFHLSRVSGHHLLGSPFHFFAKIVFLLEISIRNRKSIENLAYLAKEFMFCSL